MLDERLQFEISQYVDGTLDPEKVAALELRLESDAEARQLLIDYRRINAMVDAALPLPEVNWAAMSRRISAAVDEQQALAVTVAAQETRGFTWYWRPLALAAGILLCVGLGFLAWQGAQDRQPELIASNIGRPPAPTQPGALVQVFLTGDPVSGELPDVTVGEARPNAGAQNPWAGVDLYPDLTAADPPRVLISSVPANWRDEEMPLLH